MILGVNRVEFFLLDETRTALEPYEVLWALGAQYKKSMEAWTRGPVFSLDSSEVEKNVDAMAKSSIKLSKDIFEKSPAAARMCEQMRRDLDDFKPNLPILSVLCNKGMKDRHWVTVSSTVGFDVFPDKHTHLTRFLDAGILKVR